MEANGEIKELTKPEDPIDITAFKAVIVDEASMVNAELWSYISHAAERQKVKFIFMGDKYQLPPVKETLSPVWDIPDRAELTTVMRHDNQILTLATTIRGKIGHPAPSIKFASDNDLNGGVYHVSGSVFLQEILEVAVNGDFFQPNKVKVIAWKNATVEMLNLMVRDKLFPGADKWVVGDRIIVLEPIKEALSGETLATTDDEGTLDRVEITQHPIFPEFKVYYLSSRLDDNRVLRAFVLHPDSSMEYELHLQALIREAKADRRRWPRYWNFRESFAQIRHGYAITAHRSQGSTYEKVFVDTKDILSNRNRTEAFKCLYVACTRPKKELILT